MGKKKDLENLRKKVFAERMEKYEVKEEEEEEENYYEDDNLEEQSIKILETFNTLLEYRDINEIPILEYLDIEKFEKYIFEVLRD